VLLIGSMLNGAYQAGPDAGLDMLRSQRAPRRQTQHTETCTGDPQSVRPVCESNATPWEVRPTHFRREPPTG
jgi:hypothetical protein